jgi:hypothetical protein
VPASVVKARSIMGRSISHEIHPFSLSLFEREKG